MVETFVDVPYTEALDIDILLPRYDDGLTIYQDLINRLTTAITILNSNEGSFRNTDRIYNDDVDSWIRFGNSLKLRMEILLANVDNTFARQAVEEAQVVSLQVMPITLIISTYPQIPIQIRYTQT